MIILFVYLFSGAIYNIEIHAKMSLNMEYSTYKNCNVNHKEKSNEQINISCRFSLKKAKKNSMAPSTMKKMIQNGLFQM